MNGIFAEGSVTFQANVPKDALDKILGNTEEDMNKWLSEGNTFDLSDGNDRTVAYISFPKGTNPNDVVHVVRCRECRWACLAPQRQTATCMKKRLPFTHDYDFYCADGERRTDGKADNL